MKLTLREPVSSLTHLVGAVIALFGLLLMLWLGRTDPAKELALLIYGLSLILMLSASGIYHGAVVAPDVLLRLRKFDHSAIYLVIAGSYTPICLYFFSGFWQWGLPAIVWLMAIAGVVVKLFLIRGPRWLTTGIYLVMGWLSVMAVGEMLRSMPGGALAGLVAGGLFYTLGAVVYIIKRPNPRPGVFGFHEIWHIFVLLGAFSHFFVIAAYIAPT